MRALTTACIDKYSSFRRNFCSNSYVCVCAACVFYFRFQSSCNSAVSLIICTFSPNISKSGARCWSCFCLVLRTRCNVCILINRRCHKVVFFFCWKSFFLFPTKTNQCRNITSCSLFISGVWSAVCCVCEWVWVRTGFGGDCHLSRLTSAHKMRSITPIEQTCVQHGIKTSKQLFAKKKRRKKKLHFKHLLEILGSEKENFALDIPCAMSACFHYSFVLHDFIPGLHSF